MNYNFMSFTKPYSEIILEEYMFNSPLYESLIKHKQKNHSSFHTPGHKNRKKVLPKNLVDIDVTELSDTDSLYDATGAILKAEQQAAELFSAKRTIISAGGCTLCIQTMLKLCSSPGEKIIMGRIIHKSAINAMALLDIIPVWVYPRKDAGKSYLGRIHPDDINDALKENSQVTAVYITSPDYYGIICDIKSIAQICKKYNVPLLVDSAHGSHLPFIDEKLDPIKQGASLIAFSAHKTLPVLTGGAFLHICDDEYVSSAKEAMSIFGSTSPSYPIMASLDLSTLWCYKNAKREFCKLKAEVDTIKRIARVKGLVSPEGIVDPVRLCFDVRSIGLSGKEVYDFFKEYKIEPEYFDENSIVLIPTPFNMKRDFLRLKKAILNLSIINIEKKPLYNEYILPKLETKLSPRIAMFSQKEIIDVTKSQYRIASECACPCPPGIPIVMPGEQITKEIISFLTDYGISFINVVK